MKRYEVYFGNGTAFLVKREVEVEEWECEQDALDRVIDELEAEGSEGYFIPYEDTKEGGGEVYEDEYVTGGNSGRLLYHGGHLRIEEKA